MCTFDWRHYIVFYFRRFQSMASIIKVSNYADFNIYKMNIKYNYSIDKIIEKGSGISENDKHIISGLAKDGFVSVKDGKPEMLIPYITKKKFKKFYKEIKKMYKNSGIEKMMVDYIFRYGEFMDKFIPNNLSKENRLHSKYYRSGMTYELIFRLFELGLLDIWSEEDKQSALFVVWEE